MFTNTDEYVPVRLTLSQITKKASEFSLHPKGAVQTAKGTQYYPAIKEPSRLTGTDLERVQSKKGKEVLATALLDNGSLAGDFINAKVLWELGGAHYLRSTGNPILVCSGLNNTCINSNVVLDIDVTFIVDDVTRTIQLTVRLNEDSPLELVIGRDSI